MDKKKILLELQSFGARIDVPVEDYGRCGGAGPSDDKAFLLDGVPAMVPTLGEFAQESPFVVTRSEDGKYTVTNNGKILCPLNLCHIPDSMI